jgi:ubiquinone/menaquinone biosynthesis C-methylase UbiE
MLSSDISQGQTVCHAATEGVLMSGTYSGNYPNEHRAGEIERLAIQSKAWEPDTHAMLDRFGSMRGWSCLDVGCGPGGIVSLLSERVGPDGHVIGLDMDAAFLAHARLTAPSNVEFRQGDAFASDLAPQTFDLVHMRFVAGTTSNPERLLKEAVRLGRPGGIVALQEPDGSTLSCYPPNKAFDQLKSLLLEAFKVVGADLTLARRLYNIVHQFGLRDVQYRTAILGVRSVDPMIDYLPQSVETLRGTVLSQGLSTEANLIAALAECRAHLAKPASSFTTYTVAQVWGRVS